MQNHKYGGFVIYEGTEEVTDSNQWTAQCERNQWVWIPIEDVSNMYWEDKTDGKIYGTCYDAILSYTYDQGRDDYYSEVKYIKSKVKDEPKLDVYAKQSTHLTQYLGGISRYEFLMEMEQEFYEMLQSVATYGGFYMGRYEVGDLNQTSPVVKRMNTNINNINWYQGYKKCKKLSGTNTNVKTSMIWGTQYGQVLNWLIKTGEKTPIDMRFSVAWGNYEDTEFTYYADTSKATATKNLGVGIIIASGAYEGAKANNIYDLAGNIYIQGLGTYGVDENFKYRQDIGGCYIDLSTKTWAASRAGKYGGEYCQGVGSTMYIK